MVRLTPLAFALLLVGMALGLAACDGTGANIRCDVTPISNGVQVAVVDQVDGLKSIVSGPLTSNANVVVPAFPSGTKNPVTVTATKQSPGPSVVDLNVTNSDLGQKECDPSLFNVVRGAEDAVTARGVPDVEHAVAVQNGSPGLTVLKVAVNGKKFTLNLRHGAKTLDISSAMHQGNSNTIVLTGQGPANASANVLLWDGTGKGGRTS